MEANVFFDISVVVPTYDRASKLETALSYFDNLKGRDDIAWELIVVDNNSTDHTKAVVENFIKKSGFPTRYVLQKQPGTSAARNAGIEAAKGRWIAFVDDDCYVDMNWLESLYKSIQEHRNIIGIGGSVLLFNKSDKYVCIKTDTIKHTITDVKNIFDSIPGGNCAFNRTIFNEIGNFDTSMGPGTFVESAEDVDFIYRVVNASNIILYDPLIIVYHDHGLRTESEFYQLKKSYTIGRGAMYAKHAIRKNSNISKIVQRDIKKLFPRLINNIHDISFIKDKFTFIYWFLVGFFRYTLKAAQRKRV